MILALAELAETIFSSSKGMAVRYHSLRRANNAVPARTLAQRTGAAAMLLSLSSAAEAGLSKWRNDRIACLIFGAK
jgi:hypothetical protein